jgi:hypothetical protein
MSDTIPPSGRRPDRNRRTRAFLRWRAIGEVGSRARPLNRVGVHAQQPITRQLAAIKGHSTLPHQEGDHARAGGGGVAGGALPMSAGTSWPPTNGPARVAQPSDEGVGEADAGWASRGPRFARFAAAMEADPGSQDQLFPRSQRRIRTADPVISSARIRWLGIGSWALFCAALFVSLLLRPDRVSFQLDQIHPRVLVSDVRSPAVSMPATKRLLPAHGQKVASTAPATAPDLDARPADQGTRAGLEADLP